MAPDDVQVARSDISEPSAIWVLATVSAIIFLFLALSLIRSAKQPPQLEESIPYISNTLQLINHTGEFLDRVAQKLISSRSNIIKVHLGLIPTYIVTGQKNVQKVLNSPNTLDGNWIQLTLMDKHCDMTPEEISKFANDKSGRSEIPAQSTAEIDPEERYWQGHDSLYTNFLSKKKYSDALAASFHRLFSERLERQPTSEWATVRLFQLLKIAMSESAVISLFGEDIIDINPGFIDCYWDFDDVAGSLALGLPRLFQRKANSFRDRFHVMTENYIKSAWENFDWDGPEAESDWEPKFGSRLSRETARWLRKGGFSDHAAAGHALAALFGLNGNTIPITIWIMIELIKDPNLFQEVRSEALSCYATHTENGKSTINAEKLVKLPLMQSVYIEALRMHISFNATRKATGPIVIDGYQIEKGALVQTCSEIAHYEEAVWGVKGHAADEFWAWRHIKYVESMDPSTGVKSSLPKFAMKGRPSSFFPYGGGYVMCPGRHFAKQEIMLAVAILVTKFDIEFVGWVDGKGVRSSHEPRNDRRFAGFVAMPPDKDVEIRWKRIE